MGIVNKRPEALNLVRVTTLIILSLLVSSKIVLAQEGFFSKLYFPFTYGMNYPLNSEQLKKNAIMSNGFEYRFDKRIPWVIRFSIENLWLDYEIADNSQTNATNSELRINGYYLGAGLRTNAEKWRFLALLQAGNANYKYPVVENSGSNYKVIYNKENSFSCQTTLGIEYYFTKDFALIAESFYILIPVSNSFWNRNFQNLGFKLGITTTLF